MWRVGERLVHWSVSSLVVCCTLISTVGCQQPTPTDLARHTLIYGGDLFTSRQINYALFDEAARKTILSDVAPRLREADLAMVNLEGVITAGGSYYKLRKSSYTFRAHPLLVGVLEDAGVDLVTLGNNHVPDYGPDSLVEMTDRLTKVGIGYTGAGVDERDAARPVYRRIGDTVVAVVGIELTYAEEYRAGSDHAGGHYIRRAFRRERDDNLIVERLGRIAEEARRHAHVVLLSPHWDAWETPPAVSSEMRALAGKILDAGYDGILGHGRHEAQGVEVHNGRPVMYDAGNLVIDIPPRGAEAKGMLWEVEFTKAGITGLRGIPISLKQNRSTLASEGEAEELFDRVVERSEAFGTKLERRGGELHLSLEPGKLNGPSTSVDPPRRAKRESVRSAPNDVLLEELPPDATPVDVQFDMGIKLVGYKLLSKGLVPSNSGSRHTSQIVITYWSTDRELTGEYAIRYEVRPIDNGEVRSKRRDTDEHLPGDWMLPVRYWPTDKIIQDRIVFRVRFEPQEEVAFFAALGKVEKRDNASRRWRIGPPIKPAKANVSLFRGALVPLGTTKYDREGIFLREVWRTYERTRPLRPSKVQPWGAPPPRQGS